MPTKTYAQAINEATDQLLASDKTVIVIGEGVPSGIFGTTRNLKERYGDRVWDSPLAENGTVGFCVGATISGLKPINIHMRNDFLFLAADQIINNAAKWSHTFGKPCPLVIRSLAGRGWGNGPTHTQSIQQLFSSISGLKVVMPTSAYSAKGLLIAAVRDPNPVLFLEHRWLYDIPSEVPDEMYECNLDKSNVVRTGEDITIVALSYSTVESIKAVDLLKPFNIQPEVIDLISCHHIDLETIGESVRKTGRLLVVDTARPQGSVGAEVVRQVTENYFNVLSAAPKVIGTKDYPCPTSHFLTEDYYADDADIANECFKMCNSSERIEKKPKKDHDIPHKNYSITF
jgi:pyruvate dehydrogenase E1 component beta subunit